MEKLTINDVANYFLSKDSMTPKKLQKMVYYAYAWYITLYNEKPDEITNVLFDEKPEAWIHGPVFPSLYNKYRNYGWNEIEKIENYNDFKLNKDLKSFLDDVWKKFNEFSADQLESMTHAEQPWIKARNGIDKNAPSSKKISQEDIFNYYIGLINGE